MKRPSHKTHNARLLAIVLFALTLLFIVSRSQPSTANEVTQAGLRVQIEEGKSARATITINNRCSAPHLFRIKSNAKFLRIEQPTDSVLIQAGSNKQLGVRFEATGLKSKVYRSKVVVECLDCKKEPGCNQDRDELPVEMVVIKANQIAPPRARDSITGRVVDPRNVPVRGAEVRVPGQPVVLTDSKGEFNIRVLAATKRLAVSFSAPGFIDTTSIYKVGELSRITGNVVVIWPRAAQISLDATRGGKLTFPGGAISLPPNALIDEQGRTVSGNVRVSFSVLDVSDRRQIRRVPGDFTARMRDNTIRQLETFGVFEVFVEDANGRRANLAPGRKASVELFIPRALRRTVPSSVGLFSFDQNSGRWVEEGTLRTASDRTFFATSINRITTSWNADMVLSTTCVKLKILDCASFNCAPPSGLAGSHVEAYGVGYAGYSDGYTDANGEVCLSVKLSATVSVIAHHPSLTNIQSNPIEIMTPAQVASDADCGTSLCPLVATTHLAGAAFIDDLNSHDASLWCKSDGWANVGDPAFNVGWRGDHIDFLTAGKMRLALNNYAATPSNPCCITSNPCTTIGNACSDMPFAAGQYRTKCFYGYGTYEATFKTGRPQGERVCDHLLHLHRARRRHL